MDGWLSWKHNAYPVGGTCKELQNSNSKVERREIWKKKTDHEGGWFSFFYLTNTTPFFPTVFYACIVPVVFCLHLFFWRNGDDYEPSTNFVFSCFVLLSSASVQHLQKNCLTRTRRWTGEKQASLISSAIHTYCARYLSLHIHIYSCLDRPTDLPISLFKKPISPPFLSLFFHARAHNNNSANFMPTLQARQNISLVNQFSFSPTIFDFLLVFWKWLDVRRSRRLGLADFSFLPVF